MRTGDGFLARLPPLAEPLSPAQLAAIADASARYGNGRIEISKRGNLQIRGLATPDAGPLAAALAGAGIALAEGVPVSSDPLAATDAAAGFVKTLNRRLAAAGIADRLAPKVALVLDLGTPTAPFRVAADLRLAFRDDAVHLGLGGTHATARWIGMLPAAAALEAAVAVLGALADHGREARIAGESGLRDDPALAAVAGAHPAAPPAADEPASLIGPVGGLASPVRGIGFPFGQADAAALAMLAELAAAAGVTAFAPAPERTLLLAGPADSVATAAADAARLGFVTDAADPRRFIAACIGSEGCASGRYPSRALARAAVPRLAPLLDGSLALHFSGCQKGCAFPEPAAITLSGIDKSAGLVLDGRARDGASGFASPEKLVDGLERLSAGLSGSGETARAALERIGRAGVARAVTGEASVEHGGEPQLSE